MRIRVTQRGLEDTRADCFVVVFGRATGPTIPAALRPYLRPDARKLIGTARGAQTWLETHGLRTPRVLFVCLDIPRPPAWDPELEYLGGYAGSFGARDYELILRRGLREVGARIERACDAIDLNRVVLLDWPEGSDPELIVEGMQLRAHDSQAWTREVGEGRLETSVRTVELALGEGELSRAQRRAKAASLRERVAIVDATNFARELGDLPSNRGTAAAIVERVRASLAKEELGLELSAMSAGEAVAAGMGLFEAVDAGARERGCILRLEHGRELDGAPLILVGKGLTHDTGGYNLKRGAHVHYLTYDKCGAMAVIGAMVAIARLDLPLRVIALCPLTENAVDAAAYKPGDVIEACDGTTVYVEDTDAEGRLVLADVLAWIREHEPAPELVIDLATLTASAHGAFGEPFAALYCNEDRARALLVAAGERSGDQLWPMPIHELHEQDLGHHKAQLRNVGASAGSSSAAAAFLRSFVSYPWAHVDLGGKAHVEFARGCYGPGATGFGCRLLVEAARGLVGGL